ncbi:MAG: tRNA (guanosine(37)-N1)-methyltransferase TrmD [Phycisphaerae bacterium]|nr:tRNA (guanosine(37)-N1)-methyltransferase TrmD [Phycisphaerae bacterium]|tara:strand:- start:1344 stop:2060 length:717 start_codon:yes stop_codon:yes gene_type:complete
MRFDILTLFPEMFEGALATSIPGRAARNGLVSYNVHDIRNWTTDKHDRVDDRPFGGGPGMVMTCQPLYDAVMAVEKMDDTPAERILLSPQGRRLDQTIVEELATHPRLLMIAGRYEGIDERVIEELQPREISIGDYVLSGGELPALVLADTITRLIPGALGHDDSAAEDSFTLHTEEGTRLLDAPHYTRPRVWKNRDVPEVLISGDHGAVDAWRRAEMEQRTRDRRPDLLDNENDPTQ